MLVSAAWIVPALLAALNELAQAWLWNGRPAAWRDVAFASLDWLVYGVLTPGVFLLSRRFALERTRLLAHATLQLVMALLFCALWAGAGTLLKAWLDPERLERGASFFFTSWVFITLPFGVTVYLSMVGVEHALRWFVEARERDVELVRLSAQLATARLAALQSQLNPHFLFNTLNSIAVLARDGRSAEAARMVEQLGELLRSTLRRQRGDEVALEEELELVRRYLDIEQVRFSDRLLVDLDVAPELLRLAVPGFAIQQLVDNAVRHGIGPRPEGGRIRVAARRAGDDLEVSVSDDGVGFAATEGLPPEHGLANTRDRLRVLHGERASLSVTRVATGGTSAVLRVPARLVAPEEDRGPR